MGAGITSCAMFAQEYGKDPDLVERLYFSWAQGYMSQRNVAQRALDGPQRNLRACREVAMLRLRST